MILQYLHIIIETSTLHKNICSPLTPYIHRDQLTLLIALGDLTTPLDDNYHSSPPSCQHSSYIWLQHGYIAALMSNKKQREREKRESSIIIMREDSGARHMNRMQRRGGRVHASMVPISNIAAPSSLTNTFCCYGDRRSR